MDADQQPPTDARHPSTTALAVLLTLSLLGILLLGWVWYTRYAPVHYDIGPDATITDAEDARYIIPIILAGAVIIALLWIATWLIARWKLTLLPIVIGTIGFVTLILFAIELQGSIDDGQPITLLTVHCEAGTARPQGRIDELPDGCEQVDSQQSAAIGTSADPRMHVSEPTSDHHFTDLPQGTYTSLLTAQGQPDTATAILATETDSGILPISPLQHQRDTTWAGTLTLHPNLETYYLLLYPTPYESVPDAQIRFAVHECQGTSLASFDASTCQPASLPASIIEETVVPGTERGRPIETTFDGNNVLMTSLEARPYTFEPATFGAPFTPAGQDILVIPGDGPQESDRNVLTPDAVTPQGTFTIDITPETGEVTYNVYIVQRGTTVAMADVRP